MNVQITNRTARFLSPRSPAERMIRNSVITLAKRYPFARGLVNTGRLSSASTYTRSSINVGEWGGVSIQNVALPKHDDLVGVMAQTEGNHIPSSSASRNRIDFIPKLVIDRLVIDWIIVDRLLKCLDCAERDSSPRALTFGHRAGRGD